MSNESWKMMIKECAGDDVILSCTLSEEELDVEFDTGYGGENGKPFTAWSKDYVYFPVCYDGAEWVDRVPRNICDQPSSHSGG